MAKPRINAVYTGYVINMTQRVGHNELLSTFALANVIRKLKWELGINKYSMLI